MSAEARWLLGGAAALAALVAVMVVAGLLAPAAPSPEVQRYFDPDYLQRARAYTRWRQFWFLFTQTASAALLWLAVARGWDRLAAGALARLAGPRPLLVAALLGALLALAATAAGLPAAVARFVLDHRYGLSTQSLGLWLADLGRSTAISAVITAAGLGGLFWLLRRWPAGWWAPAAAGFALYLTLATYLWPLVIDPLYHRFTPLRDPALAGAVRELAARAGVPVDEVLVMDASRRTRRVNAYFTGLGGSRRIVLYDTLVEGYDRRHVLLVLAHELGHWRLHHTLYGVTLGALGGAAVLAAAQRLLAGRSGGPGDPAQLVLLALFLLLVSLAALPAQNAISRAFERRADAFALALAGDGPGYADLEVRLARDNLNDPAPHPLTVAALHTHPPVLERIRAALQAGR